MSRATSYGHSYELIRKNKKQLHSQAKERSTYQLYLVAFRQKGNLSLHARLGRKFHNALRKYNSINKPKSNFCMTLKNGFCLLKN